MALIVDASAAVKWVVDEDRSPDALALLDRDVLVAPDLLLLEVRNVLLTRVRRGLNSAAEAKAAETAFDSIEIDLAPSREVLGHAFDLGLSLAHPIYDCVYLAMAVERELTLVTADLGMARLARQMAEPRVRIELLGQSV